MEWRTVALLTMVAALNSEVKRLREAAGKRSESIWTMSKEDLIELARRELGMPRSLAEKETVVTLRERIRRDREQKKEESDPLMKLPPGLERMRAEELKAECEKRGLDTTPLPGTRGTCKTRPQMILMIREEVERRNSNTGTPTPANQEERPRPKPSSAPRQAGSSDDADWDMVQPR